MNTLDKNHKIYRLAKVVDWSGLEAEIMGHYSISDQEKFRLIIGLLYLKSISGMSSSEAVEKWSECPYWRYFCGAVISAEQDFPYPAAVLDIWDRELSGKGYDAMTRALGQSIAA